MRRYAVHAPALILPLLGVLATSPALAQKREREWDKVQACPADVPVLVGSQGAASRFTALSGCAEVQVVPEALPQQLNDHQSGSIIVRETARDEDGRIEEGGGRYYTAGSGPSADRTREGDVRVGRDWTAGGTPVVTIAPVEDPDGASGQDRAPPSVPTTPAIRRTVPAPSPTLPAEQIATAAPPVTLAGHDRLLDLRPDRATPFDREIAAVARRQRVDPLLLHAVVKRESAYRATVVSRAGAIGAMQVMPGTGRMLGLQPQHLRNPMANIEAGARLIRRLAQRYKGDFSLVLAAYNAGEGAVAKYGNRIPPYAETQHYVRAVLGEYRQLAARAGLTLAAAAR